MELFPSPLPADINLCPRENKLIVKIRVGGVMMISSWWRQPGALTKTSRL